MLPFLLLHFAIGLVSHASAANLTDVLKNHPDQLSTLGDTISRIPNAAQELSLLRNVTLFAPSNDAFKQYAKKNPNFTAMNNTAVSNLLLYHIVPSALPSTIFNNTPIFFPTLLTLTGPNAPLGPSASQKLALQLTAGTTAVVDKATLFSGFKQKSFVINSDIAFDGGVIHVIDSVLTLPGAPSATALNTGDLTSFYGALNKTGLLDDVDGLPDGTVFAPSNAAFEAVGSVVEAATVKELTAVLQYHVLKGVIPATGSAMFSPALVATGDAAKAGLQTTMELATLDTAGGNVTVRADLGTGNVFINSARIATSDIITNTGVIHVLDNVLNPEAADAAPDTALPAAAQTPAFKATPATAVPFTSGLSPTTTFTPAPTTGAAVPFAAVPTAALLAAGVAAVWSNMY